MAMFSLGVYKNEVTFFATVNGISKTFLLFLVSNPCMLSVRSFYGFASKYNPVRNPKGSVSHGHKVCCRTKPHGSLLHCNWSTGNIFQSSNCAGRKPLLTALIHLQKPATTVLHSLTVYTLIQAALPQGIVPFVFAKEYNLHPAVLSTGYKTCATLSDWISKLHHTKTLFPPLWLQGDVGLAISHTNCIGLFLSIGIMEQTVAANS